MRINSYLIRSKSALGHQRWGIDPALGHRSCAGPSILRWSIVRWSIDSVDARMTRAPRAARGSRADHARRAPRGNHGSCTDSAEKSYNDQCQSDFSTVQIRYRYRIIWKSPTKTRISEIPNTVLIWVPVWTELAERRRYKLEHARARARGKDGDCKLPAWRSVVKMLMDGNLLVLFGATRGNLVRVRAFIAL